MDFGEGEMVDFGDVHEVLKRGIGRIEIIGPSIVKISWVTWSDKSPERKLVAVDIWDHAELMLAFGAFLEQLTAATKEARATEKGNLVRIGSTH